MCVLVQITLEILLSVVFCRNTFVAPPATCWAWQVRKIQQDCVSMCVTDCDLRKVWRLQVICLICVWFIFLSIYKWSFNTAVLLSCAFVCICVFVCYLCVVTQEAIVGSEINPQHQMKTTHTNSQLITPQVFVYFYNNSSVWGMRVGSALCVVLHGLWLHINHVFVLAKCCWDISFD